jgi:hypothetical protein
MAGHETEGRVVALPAAAFAFVWKDFSRFVEVHPVRTGWLVLWGRFAEQGRRKILLGNRTYTSLAGARRRFADAALELTHDPALVADGLALFDRHPFPERGPIRLPEPL